jgi:death on curing protein
VSDWTCIALNVALAVHGEQIDEHGGLDGVRDLALLGSALARAPDIAACEEADVARLAATYAVGICGNHPFNDGNKRTALVLCELFLDLHGHSLDASDADCVAAILELASGRLSEPEFAAWLRDSLSATVRSDLR